jgi:hypothetical protein
MVALVQVRGALDPPTAVSVTNTLTPGYVSVAFTPPVDDGGSPVTRYTVTSYPAPAINRFPTTGTSSPILMGGLRTGTTYTFTVHANNAAGSGAESVPAAFFPPSAPLSPLAVAATNMSGTSPASSPTNAVTPQVSGAPANDNFANAQVISGASGTVTGTNVGAGKERGEPDHAGNPGGASIWYVWVAPSGYNTVTFDTCGSSFDTLLAQYQGTAVDALGVGWSNDDAGCPGDGAVSVRSRITYDLSYAGGDLHHRRRGGDGRRRHSRWECRLLRGGDQAGLGHLRAAL